MKTIKIKYCNCQISSNKNIFNPNQYYSFCEKCGCIIIKTRDGDVCYTLKNKEKQDKKELDPINIIRIMKKRTEEEYPNIYKLYNSDISEKSKNEKSINIYLKHRKTLILKLQKLMKLFNYYDATFFETLFFLDTYLSHDMTEDMSQKKMLYYLVGYFLCVIKLKEIDTLEPTFESFMELSKGIYLSPNKIADYERICLERINYNIFSYSPYDWIMILLSNGVIFNCEIENNNEIILVNGHRHSIVNMIKKYTLKLLFKLTIKPILIKYAPIYIAVSLIQISREKYIENKMIKPELFIKLIDLYGINYADYQKCYEEIKTEIEEKNKINENEEKKEFNQIDKNNNIKEKSINVTKRNSFNHFSKTLDSFNKDKYIIDKSQKRKRNHIIINSQKDLVKELENFNNNDNQDNNVDKNNEVNHNITNNNEQKIKNISLRKKHLSIDCSNKDASRNTMNIFNIKDKKEKILIPKGINKQYILSFFEQKEKKRDSPKKEIDFIKKNINFGKKRHLTSKKLNEINLEEFNNNRDYKIGNFKPRNETFIQSNFKTINKFQSNKNLINGISLH